MVRFLFLIITQNYSRSFKDNSINLATNTLANWVINSSDTYLSLLYERMHKCIYDSKALHVGETPPIILFDWKPGRPPIIRELFFAFSQEQ